jgi:hypothetical protein
MSAIALEQLTLDVSAKGAKKRLPDASTFKVSGAIASVARELYDGDKLTVHLVNSDGEVILESPAQVTQVAFKRHAKTSSQAAWTERAHTLTLAADDD